MTVSTNPSVATLSANGVTTVFPFTFKALQGSDVKVVTVDANAVETTVNPSQYTVALTSTGGNVTFSVAPASGLTVFIRNNRTYQQSADIKNHKRYEPAENEATHDSAVILIKQLLYDFSRCLRLPETEDGSSMAVLANKIARAGAFLGFDGAGAFKLLAAGAVGAPDISWIFAGTVVADQNENLRIHQTRRFEKFIGFDVTAVVAPTGIPIIIDFEKNGIVVPAWRLTLPVGQLYAELLVAVEPAINDRIRPLIIQSGNIQPGKTLDIRMRGL